MLNGKVPRTIEGNDPIETVVGDNPGSRKHWLTSFEEKGQRTGTATRAAPGRNCVEAGSRDRSAIPTAVWKLLGRWLFEFLLVAS